MNYDEPSESLIARVTDTGVGLSSQDAQKLFKKFGKLKRTASENSEGLGLGLCIVKKIVEEAGGKIHVFSKGVNRGSTFSFSMKVKKFGSFQQADEYLRA